MKKLFIILFSIALMTGFFSGCEKKSTPTETTQVAADEFLLTGKVTRMDTQGSVADAVVYFFAENPVATTTDTGGVYAFKIKASAVYSTRVFASKSGVGSSDSLNVDVFPGQTAKVDLVLKTSNPVIKKSGPAASIVLISVSDENISVKGTGANESSIMKFEVRDSSGTPVDPDHQAVVTFAIQAGPGGGEFVSPHSQQTDSTGQVSVTLGAGTKPGVLQLIAESIIGARQIQSSPVSVSIVGGLPDAAHFTLASTVSSNTVWPATADKIGDVSVQVGDKFGNPARPGTPVYFSATAGVIVGTGVTDALGKVSVAWSGGNPPPPASGAAVVTASTIGEAGVVISDTLNFEFGHVVLPYRPGAASITLVSVSKLNLSVRGAGTNESTDIIFEIRDSSGVPVGLSNKVTVDFTIQGSLNGGEYLTPASVVSDTAGRARTTFNSGTRAGVVQISAEVHVGSAVIQSSQVTITVSGGAPDQYHFSLTSNITSHIDWPQAGVTIGAVTVQVGDKYGNPVQKNTAVYLSASAGIIQGTGNTNDNGVVTATWLAGNPPPQNDGSAYITAATIGENGVTITDTLRFIFTGPAVTGGEARIIQFVSASTTLLAVDESAGPQTSNVLFIVKDSLGMPVNKNHQVNVHFTLSSAPPGAYLSPQDVNTDPQTGEVKTVFVAGTTAGPVQILAEITTETGRRVQSLPVQMQISGGLPDADHFSIASTRLNIPAWHFLNRQTGIVALVGDKYSNPTRPNTAVYFSSTGGVIENNEGFTDKNGLCTVMLISGAPWPTTHPSGPGYVYVTGRTVNEAGEQISTTITVLFSGGAIISNVQMYDEVVGALVPFNPGSDRFHIPQGGSATFTFTLSDENGNPLSEGTTMTKEDGFIPPDNTQFKVSFGGFPTDAFPDRLYGGTIYTVTISDNTVGGTPAKWTGYEAIKINAPYGNGLHTNAYIIFSGDIGDDAYTQTTKTP